MYTLSSNRSDSWLPWFLRGTLILLFLVLIGKMVEVQLIKGSYFRNLSEENRIRHIPIPAPRGRILASGGEALADNTAIKKRFKFNGNGSFTLTDDLTNATPDEVVIDYKRVYPLAEKFGHSSGYLSIAPEGEIGTVDPKCPEKGIRSGGMLIGVTGLESQYECLLRGVAGEELVEVDTTGKKTRVLAIKNPIAGTDLKTSIDFGLQRELSNLMDKKGAAIVTETNGQVLALVSAPSYDPNLFIAAIEDSGMSFSKNVIEKNNPSAISNLLNNKELPLFNRVISGTFHPGSVFKPVVALSALEEGAIDKDYRYTDTGAIEVNGFTYTSWYFTEYGRTEGEIGLTKAIARSTDTFFYKIGELTGPINMAKWSDMFGLDKPTNIDLPGEVHGLIPSPEWKRKTKKESWFLGNTYNMSIGQGDVTSTPVEINSYIQAIAADGKYCPPHFIDLSKNFQFPISNFQCRQISLKQKNLDLVKEGMIAACTTGGTAYTFFDFAQKHNGQIVACKTGTAEVGADGTPHAWFTLFVPSDKPKIVVTVLVEKGGQGSQVAGPIARKIVDYYFDR